MNVDRSREAGSEKTGVSRERGRLLQRPISTAPPPVSAARGATSPPLMTSSHANPAPHPLPTAPTPWWGLPGRSSSPSGFLPPVLLHRGSSRSRAGCPPVDFYQVLFLPRSYPGQEQSPAGDAVLQKGQDVASITTLLEAEEFKRSAL